MYGLGTLVMRAIEKFYSKKGVVYFNKRCYI